MPGKIIKELHQVLNINDWKQIKTKEQFFNLVSYMYCLEDNVVKDIVLSVENLELLIEEYFNECIDAIIDYDPSIMVSLVDSNAYIMELFSKNTHESKLELAKELKVFSKWLMLDSKVRYSNGAENYEISVYAAITMIMENKDESKAKKMKFQMMTENPENLLKDLQNLVRYGIDFGDTPYLGGDLRDYNEQGFYDEYPLKPEDNSYLH